MKEFEKLIKSNDIDEVGLVEWLETNENLEKTGRLVYEIWVDGKSAAAGVFGKKITNNDKSCKLYTSIDRAISAIKKAGWYGTVSIKLRRK